MNKNIFTIILIIILGLLQILLLPIISVYSVVPNLILIGAIILILLDFEKGAFWLAGLGGLLFDFFSPAIFGLITIYLILIVFLLRYSVKKIFSHINVLVVSGVTFITAFILVLILDLFLKEQLSIIFLLASGVYNAILAVVIFSIYNASHQKLKLIKIKG